MYGPEIGALLFTEANCEDRFPEYNCVSGNTMEPLDSDHFENFEAKRKARTNAETIRDNILKLVRIFKRKDLRDKL